MIVWNNKKNVLKFVSFIFFKQCIIVGLQSTGEASTLEQLDEAGGELTDFVSTAK